MAAKTEQPEILVFSDNRGNFYALSTADLEQWRVPEDLRDEAAALTAADEVAGYRLAGFQLTTFTPLNVQSPRYTQATSLLLACASGKHIPEATITH